MVTNIVGRLLSDTKLRSLVIKKRAHLLMSLQTANRVTSINDNSA